MKLLAAVLAMLAGLQVASACSCMPAHPQQHFCTSEFVMVAHIHEKVPTARKYLYTYNYNLKHVFKGNDKVMEVLKAGNLTTPPSGGACGVDLSPGTTYVLSGRLVRGKPYVQLCNLVERWDQVSRRQRKGLRLLYRQSCQCEVVMGAPHPSVPVPSDLCLWHTQPWRKGFEHEDCQANHAICMQQPGGHCGWTVDKFYRSCMAKAKAQLP